MSSVKGVDELRDAVDAVGLDAETRLPADSTADLIVINPAGGRLAIQVKRLSLASIDSLSRRISEWNSKLPRGTAVGVVVADRVTGDARQFLRDAGWGWLDLRGHLHLVGHGLFVDADVPAARQMTDLPTPLAGRVGIEVAAYMLLDPMTPASVRGTANALNRAPSSVSQALASLQAAGLVDEQRRPIVPDLFWELAARWRPVQEDTKALPEPGAGRVNDALRLGLSDIATAGWALTDTVAAAHYGAPVGVRATHPLDFYVPDQATLRRAVHLLGAARDHDSRAATIRVAPVPMVCADRVDHPGETWPLARPLFVALDLAQDPGRGREVLENWTPQNEGHRVW